ncbi:MAG: hypothetical protein MZV70_54485 [Desulfobacterales bacterium]|nr:hypothetical protein [Desulfobacterales bacterium]
MKKTAPLVILVAFVLMAMHGRAAGHPRHQGREGGRQGSGHGYGHGVNGQVRAGPRGPGEASGRAREAGREAHPTVGHDSLLVRPWLPGKPHCVRASL